MGTGPVVNSEQLDFIPDLGSGAVIIGELYDSVPQIASSAIIFGEPIDLVPGFATGPVVDAEELEVRVAGIKGKQLATGAEGVATSNLVDGILAASVAGRAKIATGFFDSATVSDKFASGSIALDRLAEAVIQADGGQAFTADQSFGGFKITNLGEPTVSTDGATKSYVDSISAGLNPKAAVIVATAQRVGLDGTTPVYNNTGGASARGQITWTTGPTILDGVTLANGNRMLLKNEQDGGGLGGAANGIWIRTSQNTWDRAPDFDTDAEVTAGAYMPVSQGTANGDRLFLLTTNNPITIGGAGGTALVFSSFGELQLGGTPTTISPDDTALEGTSARAARVDHRHAIAAASPTVTVKSEATAASEGVATDFLRADAQIQAATAVVVAVGTANAQGSSSSLARADHVHDSPAPTTADKNLTPNNTSGDEADTGISIAAEPALNGYVGVSVNGISYTVGDGVKTTDCFFTADGGTTAKSIANITTGDDLYWNGVIAGFDLAAATDRVDIFYEIF